MNISEWWQRNADYVKAWAGYIFAMWLFSTATGFIINGYPYLTRFGLSDSAARYTVWIICAALWWVASFLVFRGVVRKFIRQNPE